MRASRMGPRVAQPGTVAHSAIAYLHTLAAGAELSSAALAAAIGQHPSGIGQCLLPSANAGLLKRRFSDGIAMWSLGSAALADGAVAASFVPAPADKDGPSQSVVSAAMVPSIFAFASRRGAAEFSVAMSSDGRLICERHGRLVFEFAPQEAAVLRRVAVEGVRP